jgi:hypothetical protein
VRDSARATEVLASELGEVARQRDDLVASLATERAHGDAAARQLAECMQWMRLVEVENRYVL